MEEWPDRSLIQAEVDKLSKAMNHLSLKRPNSVKQLKREIVTEMAAIDRSIRHISNPRVKRRLSKEYSAVKHSLNKLEVVTSPQRKAKRQQSFVGLSVLERQFTPSRRRRTNCGSCVRLLSSGIGTKYCPQHGLYPQRL